jgi:hypothetical protein
MIEPEGDFSHELAAAERMLFLHFRLSFCTSTDTAMMVFRIETETDDSSIGATPCMLHDKSTG